MEPTPNFAQALQTARDELAKEAKLTMKDAQIVQSILDKPVVEKNGQKLHVMFRVHQRVRNYYFRTAKPGIVIGNLDWMKLIQWIKDNWPAILRIILAVAPFLLG